MDQNNARTPRGYVIALVAFLGIAVGAVVVYSAVTSELMDQSAATSGGTTDGKVAYRDMNTPPKPSEATGSNVPPARRGCGALPRGRDLLCTRTGTSYRLSVPPAQPISCWRRLDPRTYRSASATRYGLSPLSEMG